MKRIYMLAASLMLGAGAMAQQNLNLEEWQGDDPTGWQTLNIAMQLGIPQTTYQDSDAAEGNYAARIETIYYEECAMCPAIGLPDEDMLSGILAQSFETPGNDIPLTFSFSVKYELGDAGDEGIVAMQAWNWNEATQERDYVAQATYIVDSDVSAWSDETLTVQWGDTPVSPDSIEILVASSASDVGLPGSTAQEGSKIWVDDFQFTWEEGEEDEDPVSVNEVNPNDIKVYPNPTTDVLNIELNETIASVSLVGMDGRVVYTENANDVTAKIDVASLESGVYYYVVVTESGKTARNSFVKK